MKTFALIALLSLLPAMCARVGAADEPKKPEAAAKAASSVKNVGVEEFEKLRAQKDAVVLDVRTPEEYRAGHLKGSVNLDFNSPDFAKKVAELDKNKTYLVHCAAGGRSARACKKMDGMSFKSLVNLEGGMGAWEKAGKPVEK